MKNYIILLSIFFTLSIHCQINFEKGYFINNNDEKIECFIKNMAWRYNPDEIDYKLNENESSKTASINDIKEFGIGDSYFYERYSVDIDERGQRMDDLNMNKELKLVQKTLFLRKIIAGKINLYGYQSNSYEFFYYNFEKNTNVELLVYKEYLQGSDIKENINYKQKLFTLLNTSKLNEKDFESLNYTEKDLKKLFIKYNESESITSKDYTLNQNKSIVKFKIIVGFQAIKNNFDYDSKTKLQGSLQSFNTELPSKIEPNIGVELEYILPFNQKKWAVFVQPNYQKNKFELDYQNYNNNTKFIVNYSLLEIPVGVRYNVFLNEKTKIFLNTGFNLNVNLKSNIDKIITYNNSSLNNDFFKNEKLNNSTALFAGVGFYYKKTSLEIRYNSSFYTGVDDGFYGLSAFEISSIGLRSSYIIF